MSVHLICRGCKKQSCPVCGWQREDSEFEKLKLVFEQLQDEMRRIAAERVLAPIEGR